MSLRRAALLFVLLTACHRNEPVAGGKPLSHWRKEATQVSLFSFWNSTADERRAEAFRRLIEIGEPAVPALMDLLRNEGNPVSSDATNALAALGPRAARAVPELIEMLDGEPTAPRRRAAWILGSIGPAAEPAVPRLTALLTDADPRLREAAARALANVGGAGQQALGRARTSEDARQRDAALHASAVQPLDAAARRQLVAEGLADPSPAVRLRAVELLAGAGHGETEALGEYLVAALTDEDHRVSEAARSALRGHLQRGRATPRLLAMVLEGGDAESRAAAAWHLGSRSMRPSGGAHERFVVNALRNALDHEEAIVRIHAGRALVYGGGPAREPAIRQLRRDMPSAEPILAVRAARALWDVSRNVEEVRPAYERGLADPERWNRVETISAILDMGKQAETFIPHLERLSSDPAAEVRERARRVLEAIRPSDSD